MLTIVGVSRILKAEWVEEYAEARKRVFTVINVKAGWPGAGLFPFNPEKILDRLPSIPPSTPTIMSTTPNIIETALLTSSPPDITVLESANDMLNDVTNSVSPRVILLASAHISLASGF